MEYGCKVAPKEWLRPCFGDAIVMLPALHRRLSRLAVAAVGQLKPRRAARYGGAADAPRHGQRTAALGGGPHLCRSRAALELFMA